MRAPNWVIQAAVGALVTALVGGGFAWASHTSRRVGEHDKKIAVQEEKTLSVEKNIDEIKNAQNRVEQKVDRILERLSGR